jgi:hypothetical protein
MEQREYQTIAQAPGRILLGNVLNFLWFPEMIGCLEWSSIKFADLCSLGLFVEVAKLL